MNLEGEIRSRARLIIKRKCTISKRRIVGLLEPFKLQVRGRWLDSHPRPKVVTQSRAYSNLALPRKTGLAPKSRPATPEAAECKQKTNRVEMTQWTGELCWSAYGREGENRQSEYGSRCERQRQCETVQTDLRARKKGRTARPRVLVLRCCCPRVRGSPRRNPENKVRRNNNPLASHVSVSEVAHAPRMKGHTSLVSAAVRA